MDPAGRAAGQRIFARQEYVTECRRQSGKKRPDKGQWSSAPGGQERWTKATIKSHGRRQHDDPESGGPHETNNVRFQCLGGLLLHKAGSITARFLEGKSFLGLRPKRSLNSTT